MSHGDRRSQTWTLEKLGIRVPKLKRHRVRRRNRLATSDDDDEPHMPVHKLRWPSNPVAAVLILTALWVCLYCGSLAGGDLHTVVTHLGRIAACFFSAVACFLAALYVSAFAPGIPKRTRVALVATITASWNLLFLYDHGGTLRRHGAYNMLVFAVFVVPSVGVGALEYALWRVMGWRKLATVHVPLVLLAVSATTRSLQRGVHLWDRGFRGERIAPATTCAPVNRGLPWVDVLPAGAQNFWAGARNCKSNDEGFHVNFTMDGALSVRCNAENRRTYTPLPSTRDWPKEAKLVEEAYEGALRRPFNKHVMERIREAVEVEYATKVPPDAESLIVRCGDAEQLVARVRPLSRAGSDDPTKLDVVFLFLDATSRRAFHRRLPLTVATLEAADARGATRLYQFFRYNVMSFCTEANSRAMFQGCVGGAPGEDWVSPLWEDFARSGWVTLYTADTCQDLNAAYMNKNSLEDRRCFDHELVAPFCHADFFAEDANPFGNFKGPYAITARCLKGRHVHAHAFNYLDSFRDAYPRRARFSLAWFLEGHEGTTEVLRYLDDELAKFVRKVEWNRTVLVIAADHGLHMGINFGLFRNGAVEHKNPMLAVMLPPWFADQEGRHEVMRVNQQRLVTGLDLYRTLQGIRLAGSKERTWIDEAEEERSKSGIDLLQKDVPENRTCNDAEIPETWCQCL